MTRHYSTAAFTNVLPDFGPDVSSHPAFSHAIIVSPPSRAWREAVVARLNELCALPIGWDGYKAPPVSFTNANFALQMLVSACPSCAKEPQIVPGPDGDLQIEWHTLSADIELHVRAPYVVDASRVRQSDPDREEEHHLTTDFAIVARWLTELSENAVAARSAAA
ncbi:MAG TPA: hypothetical protein VEH76_00170 [Methylocystis sp.]|nr:hypothetical protein [Methylocystis sp.]